MSSLVSMPKPSKTIPAVVVLGQNDRVTAPNRLTTWLLANRVAPAGPESSEKGEKHAWWKVMTLTGVDYFSTLSYLPAIAV